MEKEVVVKGIAHVKALIGECEKKIEKGGNEKSLRSLICGYKRDLNLLLLLNDELGESEKLKLIRRLGRLGESDWEEIGKEIYLREEGYLHKNYKVKEGKYYRR